jgi:hypothetical protein
MNDPPPPRPIFEEPTEALERDGPEEGPLGFLLGGTANAPFATLGAQYLKAAELLIDQVDTRDVWDYEISYPVLHLMRHALELLLKACLVPPPHGHELDVLLQALTARLRREHDADLPAIAQARIAEFAAYDPAGIAFRYSQVRPRQSRGFGPIPSEAHVDLRHLRRTMVPITQGLAELAPGLMAGDRAAVRQALATMGGAGARG